MPFQKLYLKRLNPITTKIIQVTLKKENGSFGIVIRGGDHELLRKRRPFTVVYVNQQGPAYAEGTIRKGDRIRAINGSNLASTRLPELQGLLYQQDKVRIFQYFAHIYIARVYYPTSSNLNTYQKYFRKQYLQSNMTSWFNLDIPIQTIMDQFL